MGEIVFWALVRAAIIVPVIWFSRDYIDYQLWWPAGILALYGVILHPAIISYNIFVERNKPVTSSTLCSSCKHFDKTAVLCLKHDEHPTENYLPCDAMDWEPTSGGVSDSEYE